MNKSFINPYNQIAMKIQSFITILFSISLLFSCGENNTATHFVEDLDISMNLTTRGEGNIAKHLTNHTFFSQFDKQKNQIIEKDMADIYIAQALENSNLYQYKQNANLKYSYGDILYQSTKCVAVSFRYNSNNKQNTLNALFIATYNPLDDSFIDARMVNCYSEFDYFDTKGYNLREIQTFSTEVVNNSETVLEVKCKNKKHFYNINEKISAPLDDKEKIFLYRIDKKGKFTKVNS